MTTNTPLSFLIRDGLEADIEACLAIDHSYETDHVWRMSIQQEETQQWNITFMVERLPRTAGGEVDRVAAKQAYGDQMPVAQ